MDRILAVFSLIDLLKGDILCNLMESDTICQS